MIAKLIEVCIRNRMMVLLITGFAVLGGVWSIFQIKVDAIPDLSDVQVIIRTEYGGQAPRIVEDQVTYPLTTAMLAVPKAKTVRGYSMFGVSFVYIIFEDGTDQYWARSRVLEKLSVVRGRLPGGVSPELGPDATGVGWIYEYVLVTGKYCAKHPGGLWHDEEKDAWFETAKGQGMKEGDFPRTGKNGHGKKKDGKRVLVRVFRDRDTCPLDGSALVEANIDLAKLRSIQDWNLRYGLTAIENVSEVATVGGAEKQYQITVDPRKLLALGKSIQDVQMAVERSNMDTGGRVIELSETEYMVRGLGYLGRLSDEEVARVRERGGRLDEVRTRRVLEDLKRISLGASTDGKPVYLMNVADVAVGPEMRRGIVDWNGEGETVGGIVLMRSGENAKVTIDRVKVKLGELVETLPGGVGIETAYDRSDLIGRAVATLTDTLIEEVTVVALVCIMFLLHARSELVAVFVVPTGVVISIFIMHLLGINANIMSLGGIAIAIGVMVDSSIVMVENAHKHLDRDEERLAGLKAMGIEGKETPRQEIMLAAAKEVGPSLFFALLVLTVGFLPVFVLGEQSGRLFKPLAYTKTFAMAASSLLAVTVIPVLMTLFITSRVLPKEWGWKKNTAITLGAMVLPAWVIYAVVPGWMLGELESYRAGMAVGWMILLGMILVPQKIIHEQHSPISWVMQKIYHPFFVLAMRWRTAVVVGAVVLVLMSLVPLVGLEQMPGGKWVGQRYPGLVKAFPGLGSEFMPPLEEGDLLYMPTTDPGISGTKARELIQQTDAILKGFPEVVSVMGKAGQAETATDPAPLSMVETTIVLERDKSKWRHVPVSRFFDDWPQWMQKRLGRIWAQSRPITVDELVYGYHMETGEGKTVEIGGMNKAVSIPGLTNSWTMPIKTRIDMLSTGIKTPVGIKMMGDDLEVLSDLAEKAAQALKTDARTGSFTTSAFAEKTVGGNYLDITLKRDQIARYGLTVQDVQDVIATALGGMMVGTAVEGRERYGINIRYPRELRDDLPVLRQTLVPVKSGMGNGGGGGGGEAMGAGGKGGGNEGAVVMQVPLGQLAEFGFRKGPDMIKSENAKLTSWVYVDIAGIDLGGYVRAAKEVVKEKVAMPVGYDVVWSGQYEYWESARRDLTVASAITGVLILLLLYMSTRSWFRVFIVCLAVPFSLVGAVWMLYGMDYNISLAVVIGMIALAGLDAETGLVMLLYLDNSYEMFKEKGRMRNSWDLWHAVHDGAVKRIRPKTMTVMTTFIGLVPLLWADGAGADTMRRLAVPMIGGLATSFTMELIVYPIIFVSVKEYQEYTGWSENQVTLLLVGTLGLGMLWILGYNTMHRKKTSGQAQGMGEFKQTSPPTSTPN